MYGNLNNQTETNGRFTTVDGDLDPHKSEKNAPEYTSFVTPFQ